MLSVTRKWRPSLALVIALVCAALVALPIVGVLGARLSSNQFARETEKSLLAQAAILAEVYATAFATHQPQPAVGHLLDADQIAFWTQAYHPIAPRLDLAWGWVAAPRPDPMPVSAPPTAPYSQIASGLSDLAVATKSSTLSGYIFLDHDGRAIASSGAVSGRFAHIPEVAQALLGTPATRLRYRSDQSGRHLLASISRDTAYRVFVAHPVIVDTRVIGAVYLSRTPMDLRKFLYQERHTLIWLGLFMVVSAGMVGALMWRLISQPIHDLSNQSKDVASGLKPVPDPVRHYGLRELAELGHNVVSMAERLSDRSAAIETYTTHVTHELKSPVTAILGAAELLADAPDGAKDRHRKLVSNIQQDGQRMIALLGRLRELARASVLGDGAPVRLSDVVAAVDVAGVMVAVQASADARLPMSRDQGQIVLHHLLQNAAQHGATKVRLTYDTQARVLTIADNGCGISDRNRDRITEPFFTTRRDAGGTGIGLAIVVAILKQAGARLDVPPSQTGATFKIWFDRPIGLA